MRVRLVPSFAFAAALLAQPGSGQQPFDGGFRTAHLPTEADGAGYCRAYVIADLDGDGDLDVAAARDDGQDRIWVNDGDGHFADETGTRMPTGSTRSRAMAAADVDGDGDLDLAVAHGAGQDRLLRNDGSGHFADDTATSMPLASLATTALAFADIDADGDRDLLLGQSAFVRPVLLRNDGSGHFADVSSTALPAVAQRTTSALAADFDGDSDVDLMLLGSNSSGQGLGLLLQNDGGGTFAPGPALPATLFPAAAAATGDVDGDGDPDVVVGSLLGVSLWRNDGGAFTDVTAAQLPPPTAGTPAIAVQLADLDGDSDLDLCFSSNGPPPPGGTPIRTVRYRNAGGTFQTWPAAWNASDYEVTPALAAADLDGDSDVDLLIGTTTFDRLYLNDGGGAFTATQRRRIPVADADPGVPAVGDFDADGDLDVMLMRTGLCRNDGHGSFSAATPLPAAAPDNIVDAAVGDLDGDLDLDVMCTAGIFKTFLRNDGAGNFTVAPYLGLPTGDTATRIALADLEGDGDLDVVFGNQGAQNRLFTNDGSGNFTEVTAAALPALVDHTEATVFADVDGDGDPDLLLASRASLSAPGQVLLFANDGTGHFTDVSMSHLPAVAADTGHVAVADFDGDGALDLFLGNAGPDLVLWNDGTGHFTAPLPQPVPAHAEATTAVLCADLDRDGDADLLVCHAAGARLYANDGAGTFVEPAVRLPAALRGAVHLRAFDADRDDDLDVLRVGAVAGHPPVALHGNRQVDCAAPWLAVAGRPYRLQFACRPGQAVAGCVAIPAIGFGYASPAIPVPPFGWFLLDPLDLLHPQPWVALDQVTGTGALAMAIPADPVFLDLAFFAQAFVVDPTGVATHLTNTAASVVQR